MKAKNMNQMISIYRIFTLLLVTCIILVSLMVHPLSLKAEAAKLKSLERSKQVFVAQSNNSWTPPPRPADDSFWSWLISLGRRGPCSNLKDPMTALIPFTQRSERGFDAFGMTINSHPTFWIYIPQLPPKIKVEIAELTIQDQEGNDFLVEPILVDLFGVKSHASLRQPTRLVLPGTSRTEKPPQIIGISLPPGVKGLPFGRFYHWYFSIICDPRRPSRNPSVDGWIGVIKPQRYVENEIKVENGLERSRIYAKKGLWHETLETLVTSRCKELKEPQKSTFSDEWSSLLKDEDVNLNNIADKSVSIEECIFPSKNSE